jgi:hypothetical protein
MSSCAKPTGQDACRRYVIVLLPLLAVIFGHALADRVSADEGGAKNRLVSATDRTSLAKLNKLIAQLGDETFAVREEATDQLIRAGIEAKPLLLAALSSTDAEVRFRAKRVLDVVVEGDFQRRLKAFEEDVDGIRGVTMPGWNAFKEFSGDNRAARALFAEMQRAEPQLLEAYESDPKLAAQTLAERLQLMQLNSNGRLVNRLNRNFFVPSSAIQAGLGTSITMLLVGGDKTVAVKDDVADRFRLVQTSTELRTALSTGDERSELCRKIVGRWIRREVSETATNNNLSMALQLNLSEGLEPATRVLKKGNGQLSARYVAALVVGNHGGKEHLPLIEPMLSAADRVSGGNAINVRVAALPNQAVPVNRVVTETQLRDIALVVAIKISGQNPVDFGFKNLTPADQKQLQIASALQRMGFPNNEDRVAAFQKWEEWQKGQKQAAKEKPKSDTIER